MKEIKNLLARSVRRNGVWHTTKRVLEETLYKPPRTYLNYLRWHKHYPHNLIFIAAHAKSGSTWISRMLASLKGFEMYIPKRWRLAGMTAWDDFSSTDLYEEMFSEMAKRLVVIQSHTWGTSRNIEILNRHQVRYLITVRDPRDKIISAYHHLKKLPDHWDFQYATMSLSQFITHKLKSGEYDQQSLNWLRKWLDHYDESRAMMIKYEEIVENTFLIMKKALEFLHIAIDDQTCYEIVQRNSFKSITGRERGTEDQQNFHRKASPGEWVSVFTPEQKELFQEIGEDVIRRLGYPPTL